MAQLGADVEALETLATDTRRQAQTLTRMRSGLDSAVSGATWRGADADRFRSSWRTEYGAEFGRVARLLGEVADQLARHARQQRQTSAATGGGAGPGGPGVFPGSTGGPAPTIPRDADADDVAMWWDRLSPEQQAAVLAQNPGALGNLDGLPASVRDEANRAQLAADETRLRDQIAALEGSNNPLDIIRRSALERELVNVEQVQDYLADVEGRTDPLTDEPVEAQLYVYEPGAFNGDGRVAISQGDLDTADHVAVSVPGITNDVSGMSPGNAGNLYDESRHASGESVAVLDWMGYDAPSVQGFDPLSIARGGDIGGTVNRDMAVAGAELLAADVEGLRASRADDPTHLTVVAHSYGSTTASWAAADHGMQADDLILIGSPGAGPADDAGDLSTGRDHTWVGASSRDFVTTVGETGWVDPTGVLAGSIPGVELLGNDPSEGTFGATRFAAEREGESFISSEHSSYFNDGSESLYNMAAIVGGEPDQIITAEHRYDPLLDASVGVEANVDVDGGGLGIGIQRGPFGVPLPSVDVDLPSVDADVDVDVDVDVAMQDPELDRQHRDDLTHAGD